jgi:hypothetical protein
MSALRQSLEPQNPTASIGCEGSFLLDWHRRNRTNEAAGSPNGERGGVGNCKAEKGKWVTGNTDRFRAQDGIRRRALMNLGLCGLVAEFGPENTDEFGCDFRAHHFLGNSSGRRVTNFEMAQPHLK